MQNDQLQHYGVKGMRWGVRRTVAQLGRRLGLFQKRPPAAKTNSETASKPKPKKISEMSDDELRQKLARFDLEKRYKQALSEMTPKPTQSWIKKFLIESGDKAIRTMRDKAFEQIAKNIFETKSEERRTNTSFTDYTKASDKSLSDALKRKANEAAYKKLLDKEGAATSKPKVYKKLKPKS